MGRNYRYRLDGWNAIDIGANPHFFNSQDLKEMLEDLTQKAI